MKQFLLTCSFLLTLVVTGSANGINHYFVKAGAEGQGTAWKDAFGDLQKALAVAVEGDVIWVSTGVYTPTQSDDRTARFVIPSGVKVYGGFAGNEKKLEDRPVEKTLTVLSGEIGDPTTVEDNSYTIVYFENANTATLLDGFYIMDSYANGMAEVVDPSLCGGGVFNNGSEGASSPEIANCFFVNNFAREGGALYNYAENGEASPVIRNCQFEGNRANFNGGAIFNDGNFGTCNPTITNCYFDGNESMYGAGVLNRGNYGVTQPVITDCHFYNNFSVVRGGAIYNQRDGKGLSEALVTGCIFEDNASTVGDNDVDGTIELNPAKNQPSRSGIRKRTTTTEPGAAKEAIGF
ncbi:MAG: hypothetical protein R2795_13980 [Saprospiraceae bacterium]